MPEQIRVFEQTSRDRTFMRDISPTEIKAGHARMLGTTNGLTSPSFIVWGDSHAMALLPAFDAAAQQLSLKGCAATFSATAPVLNFPGSGRFGLQGQEAIEYNQTVFEYIRERRIRSVFLIAMWSIHSNPEHSWNSVLAPDRQCTGLLTNQLVKTVQQLKALGCRVFVVSEVPQHPANVPRALTLAFLTGQNEWEFGASVKRHSDWTSQMRAATPILEKAGALVIDFAPYLLDQGTGTYRLSSEGQSLYQDRGHLSRIGATKLSPVIRSILAGIDHKDEP
jgi:hypothetical protein